jgi:hypothetical protein
MAPRIGVTFSELVHDDETTRKKHTVTPKLEEGGQTRSTLVAHSKCTTSFTSIIWSLNIVLEEAGSAIVGESFTKFDYRDQEGSFGKWLANVSKRLSFLFTREDAIQELIAIHSNVSI